MKSHVFMLLGLAAVSTGSPACALEVPAGCAVPNPQTGHHSFFVDPVKGDMANDGSAAHPWRTLGEVVDGKSKLLASLSYATNHTDGDGTLHDLNPSGPIKPGDVINLMSGDHGDVVIVGAVNPDFISVQAAPGQHPMIRSLKIVGASKWMFTGLDFRGTGDGTTSSTGGGALVRTYGRASWFGPTDNLIFRGNSIATADDVDGWSDEDWVKKPFATAVVSGAPCTTISANHVFNVRNAVQILGDDTLVADNAIDNFGNDGIEIVASDLAIRHNRITNGRHTNADPLHPDGIQGWTANGATNRNVLIDGNTVIKTGDQKISTMQGITIFDGKWENVTISNNVVVTNHWHGISVSGIKTGKIINNTVLAFDPVKYPTWINLGIAKDGAPPENVVIRNNIATVIKYSGTDVKVDHNIIAKMLATPSKSAVDGLAGKLTFFSKPGRYADSNIINPAITGTFEMIDHFKGVYDLRLRASSPAIGAGDPDGAPDADITGVKRHPPIDVGAYAY